MNCNPSGLLDRRAFLQLSGLAALSLPFAGMPVSELRIRRSEVELAHGHRFITTTYNGRFPGPVLRATVGQPLRLDVLNETDTTERLHFQGQAGVVAGVVPPHSSRRMEFTPSRAGLYLYHSEVIAAADLGAGLYSGQSGALLVEPFGRSLVVLKGCEPFMRRTARGCEVGYSAITLNGQLPGVLRPFTGELHLLNAGATETVSVELPGHVFEVTALDGNPFFMTTSMLRLSPGERVSARVDVRKPVPWVVQEVEPTPVVFAGVNGGVPDGVIPLSLTRHPAARSGFNRWSVDGSLRVTAGGRYRFQIHNTSDEAVPLELQRHRLQVGGVFKDVVVVGARQRTDVDFVADRPGPALFQCTRRLHSDFGLRAPLNYAT